MSNKLSRKEFLKFSGFAAAALPATKVVKTVGDFEIVESPEEYGGFLVRRLSEKKPPYEIDESTFERFDEYNTMFGRATWDEDYQALYNANGSQAENRAKKNAAGVPGWNNFEINLSTAAWWLARNRGANSYGWVTEPNETQPDIEGFTTAEITNYVKKATLFLGASTVGVTELNEKWFYKTIGRNPESNKPLVFGDVDLPVNDSESPEIIIPKSMNRVVVFTIEMDYDAFAAGGVNQVNSAGAGQGYTKMALVAGSLAAYIRSLGFQAIPCGNDTGTSIPMAIDAGLGEDSRMGLLVTPKYGPRIRLAKVITDMPLETDSPISFGVREFCEVCGKCAEYCPSGCIPTPEELPEPSFEPYDINNRVGVKKWQVRQAQCHAYWNECGVGCGNCLAVCPFNKPEGWLHEATRILIGAKVGSLDSLMVNLDEASGYGGTDGENPDPKLIDYFWNEKEEFIHIKG